MFYCDLRIELSVVCLYRLYRELDTLLLYYLLYTLDVTSLYSLNFQGFHGFLSDLENLSLKILVLQG